MNDRKKIILIIIMCIILVGLSIALFKLLKDEKEISTEVVKATTTLEDRKKWNDFLHKNPYISELEDVFFSDTDIIKAAISSEDIELEYVITEEIDEIPELSVGEGYKKSKKNINEYAKKIFNIESISYNFIDTYVKEKEEKYLIIGEDYVYFTKIELPQKEYILVNLDKKGNNYNADIYEYEINENNSTKVKEMIESGIIDKDIDANSKYTITGIVEGEEICVLSKTQNKT